jgi:GNAT superfamily N-acetyltransferase
MSIREIRDADLDAVWPRLTSIIGEEASGGRLHRVHEMMAGGHPYCLLAEDGEVATGLAAVEHYRSAWIFEDHIAAIREFIARDDARDELLAEITSRGRAAGVDNLSRFTTADDKLLPWWLANGFVEYMAAFRRELVVEEAVTPSPIDDGIVIREVTNIDKDWPKLWPLFEKLNQHHASITGRPLSAKREEDGRSNLAEELAGGEAMVMLAEDGGVAVATSSAELGAHTGFRSRLYIDEAYRGRGLSMRFEAQALPWFRRHGVTDVERWIVAGNERPRQIWAKRGYRPERLLLRKAL